MRLNRSGQAETILPLNGLLQRQERIEETLADDGRRSRADHKSDKQPELPAAGPAATGWERARELYYKFRKHGESFEEVRAQLNAYRESLNRPDGDSLLTLDPVADVLISTAVTVAAATLSDNSPVRDATTMRQHIDSKAYRETQRKKIAMGHKADDHEDEDNQPNLQQTMSM